MATGVLLNIDSQIQQKKLERLEQKKGFATSNSQRNCSGNRLPFNVSLSVFRIMVLVNHMFRQYSSSIEHLGRARGKVFLQIILKLFRV